MHKPCDDRAVTMWEMTYTWRKRKSIEKEAGLSADIYIVIGSGDFHSVVCA